MTPKLIEVRVRLVALPSRSAETGSAKGRPPKNTWSAPCISGCTLNRRPAVIGLMESYRIHNYDTAKTADDFTSSVFLLHDRKVTRS